MSESKLSPPITYETCDVNEIIESAYQSFKNGFMNKDNRPKYKGKFIFFNVNKNITVLNQDTCINMSLDKPERFYHIISIDEKEYCQVYPCYNTVEYETCEVQCETIRAKGYFAYLERVECLYRVCRIHRISEVIELANINDEHIEQWIEKEKDKNGNEIKKAYIRYTYGNDDYLVILKVKNSRNGDYHYEFITAFPVFLKRSKQQLSKNYNLNKKNSIK